MSSHQSHSGQYRFDNYTEKMDEVELVNNESYNADTNTKWESTAANGAGSAGGGGGGGGCTRVFFLVLLLLIMILQLVVVGLIGYLITQSTNSNCACDVGLGSTEPVVNDGTQSPTASQLPIATCNTTQIQNDIYQVILKSMTNGSTGNIFQLLEDLQAIVTDFQTNATEMMSNTEDSLEHIVNTLSNHKDTSISTSSVVDDILIGVNELLDVHNTSSLYDSITPVSCKMIKDKLPDSPSGYYHVNARDIYCNMDELCGSGGGWTRLAYLDMTDSTESCPDELQYLQYNGVRMCRRPSGQPATCSTPIKFPSNGISYTEICGRVVGYQRGSTDAVDNSIGPLSGHNDLNANYVDGISLTKGSPRQHVWTFMSGLQQDAYTIYNCPCNEPPGGTQDVQWFVGSHYFCESGNPTTSWATNIVRTDDPLWDGKGCGAQEGPCCSVDGLPWFHRQYDNATTDSLDMRLCSDQESDNEGAPVSVYEIYVK